ncbi:MAG: hypothetical protein AAF985_00500 [Bacteroidota bacterium]
MKINLLNFKFLFVLALATVFASCSKDEATSVTESYTDTVMEAMERDGHIGRRACFELVYPITLEFPDGTTESVNNRIAIRATIIAWKAANPDVEGKPNIQLPYDIELQDGSIATVNDQEELKELVGDCDKGPRGSFRKCYRLIFPVTVDFPDGTATEYGTIQELRGGIKDWKMANPDATERPALAFPYDVLLKDGSTTTISSEDEEQALLDSCGDNLIKRRCFRPVLPVTIEFPDGTTAEATTKEELKDLFKTWKEENPGTTERPSLAFPYNVQFKDGTTATVNSQDELDTLKEECE